MNKKTFLSILEKRLSALPKADRIASLEFYGELIDDRLDEGLSEEQAIDAIGSAEDIADRILDETPLNALVKEHVRRYRKPKPWEIVALVIGSPVWASLLLATVAVVLALYLVLWSLVVSLYAVQLSLAAAGLAGLLVGISRLLCYEPWPGVFLIGGGLIAVGFAVLFVYVCKYASVGMVRLTKRLLFCGKRAFGKERGDK